MRTTIKAYFPYILLTAFALFTAGSSNGQTNNEPEKAKGATMKTDGVVTLTDANFETEVAKGVTLIDFWAPWCGPCRMQGPIVEKVAKAMAGKAKIGKCNVDDSPKSAQPFGIRGIPTLIIMKDGQEVERFVGVRQEAELTAALKKHLP